MAGGLARIEPRADGGVHTAPRTARSDMITECRARCPPGQSISVGLLSLRAFLPRVYSPPDIADADGEADYRVRGRTLLELSGVAVSRPPVRYADLIDQAVRPLPSSQPPLDRQGEPGGTHPGQHWVDLGIFGGIQGECAPKNSP